MLLPCGNTYLRKLSVESAFYPFNNKILYILLASTSWYMIGRYGYVLGGALSVNTPIDIFYMPLPYLMGKGIFW